MRYTSVRYGIYVKSTNHSVKVCACLLLDFSQTCKEYLRMFSTAGKRCFTIESLVAKESPMTADEPIRPTALSYTSTPTDGFMSGYQPQAGRSLYPNPELVFPETVSHPSLTVHPHQLGSAHLQHPHFFSTQHREPLNFYPWVLRNRFFSHRFQGKQPWACLS